VILGVRGELLEVARRDCRQLAAARVPGDNETLRQFIAFETGSACAR
jgi:hypothetical protein